MKDEQGPVNGIFHAAPGGRFPRVKFGHGEIHTLKALERGHPRNFAKHLLQAALSRELLVEFNRIPAIPQRTRCGPRRDLLALVEWR